MLSVAFNTLAQFASMATTLSVAPGPKSQNSASFTTDELRQIQEYDRIIHFRNAIVAGQHPRIKVPGQTMAKAFSSPAGRTGVSTTQGSDFRRGNLQSFNANAQQPVISMPGTGPSAAKPFGGLGKTPEIDPLLLTKSDELIKAELQLSRQRLERSLRDQIDQRRANKTALQSSEQAPDLDLSDILAKALTLVQATAPPPAPTDAKVAANASDLSDSFDENTFYSKDTQRQNTSSPLNRTVPPAAAALTATSFAPASSETRAIFSTRNTSNPALQTGNIVGQQNTSSYIPHDPEALVGRNARAREEIKAQVISSNGSGATSRSGDSGNADSVQLADPNRLQSSQQVLTFDHFANREPPLVRAHNLSPFAPQPAHVSPLATARQPVLSDPEVTILSGAPAQVAALRQEVSNATSPESSPHGEKGNKKEKKKSKKKRKATEGRATDQAASPYVKTEPRSPSPSSAPQFLRRAKRQRPLQRPAQSLNYDEPGADQPVEIIQDDFIPRPVREERAPIRYERVDDAYSRRHSVLPPDQRAERPVYEERRVEGPIHDERRPDESIQYVRRVPSPGTYAVPYVPGETRPMRSATYSAADPIYRDAPVYYPDRRVSVRPVAERARSRSPVMIDTRPYTMGPPRPLPPRIIRDQYGREYIEPPPPPPTVSRHSVAPAGRPAEHDVIYERAPVRSASRMPGTNTFERDGVIYRRASPVPTPRRVITQPEYATVDYRSYRQRDYSVQPGVAPMPPQEFVSYRGAAESTRDYPPRAASVRPVDHVRYEYGRVQSVRPDVPNREYAASVHPESRREPPILREYSVRPVEPDMPRREYSVRPVERYHDQPVMREGEVAFIEHPRAVAQEVVYEDGRRQVYR